MHVESALLFESREELVARVFRHWKPRTPVPQIHLEFRRFANVNSTIQLRDGLLHLRVSDLLEGAPAPVLEALVHILVCKLYRKEIPAAFTHRYRLYLNRQDVRRTLALVREQRGRKYVSGPEGAHYNLDPLFDELNLEFFNGLMGKPRLGWSRTRSRTLLGHYDPTHNAIILSRLLDSPRVPLLAVRYVLFHEMLHLEHPVEHRGVRRRVHTREFRESEKRFPELKPAREALKRICQNAVVGID